MEVLLVQLLTTSVETGFVLDDDDGDDLFTVDWAMDPVFGTPVFRAASNAGDTSCPYEQGADRTKGAFTIEMPIQYVPAGNNVANFFFNLGNISETDEENDYILELVYAGGGTIQVAVGSDTDGEYNIDDRPAGSNLRQEVIITRNNASSIFDYEGLIFKYYSACDEDRAIYRTLSVFYESPCSDIVLFKPK